MTVFSECFAACILNLYMVCFFCHENNITITDQGKADAEWVKTPYPNLIRYKPSGKYFGRVRVNGKLIRRSLDTHVLTVAKLKLSDFLQDHRRRAVNKGQAGGALCMKTYGHLCDEHSQREALKVWILNSDAVAVVLSKRLPA